MRNKDRILTPARINRYIRYLREQERSEATLEKYTRDVRALARHLDGTPATKSLMLAWKHRLVATLAPSTVNAMLTAVNGFFKCMGWQELVLKPVRVQRRFYLDEARELARPEYARLVHAARREGKPRLAMVIQTICATGIRVSELRFITVEAVARGRAEISNKGKRRTVFLPAKLRELLRRYCQKENITAGAVFVTRTGKPLDRCNIWRAMKRLCQGAGVAPEKVFPHNLRHLFAREFYSQEGDLSRLADILGHSSIDTTRIYTAESGSVHARQMERLRLIIT